MDRTFNFTVNGQPRTTTTDPGRSLLDVLREDLHLTGAKYGCGEGQCRACTVLMNGKTVPACLTQVSEADQQSILTIEGVSEGEHLHPVQQAFLDEGAFQCGYCTAGMILGVIGLLKEKPNLTEAEAMTRLQKHLCRCCSYPKIKTAILKAIKNGGNGAKISKAQ
jgi:aerobic-type carbon monoxide dehydrogenase small subunit (CoxS/CutS family)